MTPLQNKIEEAKKRFEEQFDQYNPKNDNGLDIPVWTGSDFQAIRDFLEQELTSIYTLAQEEARKEMIEKVNQLPEPEVDTDFNDGGDPEYANRRIAVDSAVLRGFRQAKRIFLSTISNPTPQ